MESYVGNDNDEVFYVYNDNELVDSIPYSSPFGEMLLHELELHEQGSDEDDEEDDREEDEDEDEWEYPLRIP